MFIRARQELVNLAFGLRGFEQANQLHQRDKPAQRPQECAMLWVKPIS